MTTLRLRKKVKFPHRIWKYVYCKERWSKVPPPYDESLSKFVSTWGEGSYQIINSKGYVVRTFCIEPGKMGGYKAKANGKGHPIIPDDISDKFLHCVHCWHKGYEKGQQHKNDYSIEKNDDEIGDYENGFINGYQFAKEEAEEESNEYNEDYSDRLPRWRPQGAPLPIRSNYDWQEEYDESYDDEDYPNLQECIYCGYIIDLDIEDSTEIYDEENNFEGFAHRNCADQDEELE